MLMQSGPLRLRLDQGSREAVAERYERAGGAVERTNCQMLLLADEGRSLQEIAWLVRRGREQVRTMLHGFRDQGLAALVPRPRTGRPLGVTPDWLAELQRVIELDPHTVGVPSAVWTTRLLADYLARGDGASNRHRGGARAPASTGLLVQAAHLEPQAQVDRAGGLGKTRIRVEAILAATASPEPPPIHELMPDPLLPSGDMPEDLPWLLRLLPRADVYLRDEVGWRCIRPSPGCAVAKGDAAAINRLHLRVDPNQVIHNLGRDRPRA
jgi:transposase